MAAEISRSALEFPGELPAILAGISGQHFSKPVWTLSKQRNGYSLKLFWRKTPSQSTPTNARPTVDGKKSRSRRRMEEFLAKKRSAVSYSPPIGVRQSQPFSTVDIGDPPTCAEKEDWWCVEAKSLPCTVDLASIEGSDAKVSNLDRSHTVKPAIADGLDLKDPCPGLSIPMAESAHDSLSSQATSIDPTQQSQPQSSTDRDSPAISTPVAMRTRSCGATVTAKHIPNLRLPGHVKDVTVHHPDFVRCEDSETAEELKEAMKNQWCDLVYPGRKVKVRVKDELVDGEVETCHYISKLSFDCLYFYATAKVDVRVLYLGITKDFQFRDLLL